MIGSNLFSFGPARSRSKLSPSYLAVVPLLKSVLYRHSNKVELLLEGEEPDTISRVFAALTPTIETPLRQMTVEQVEHLSQDYDSQPDGLDKVGPSPTKREQPTPAVPPDPGADPPPYNKKQQTKPSVAPTGAGTTETPRRSRGPGQSRPSGRSTDRPSNPSTGNPNWLTTRLTAWKPYLPTLALPCGRLPARFLLATILLSSTPIFKTRSCPRISGGTRAQKNTNRRYSISSRTTGTCSAPKASDVTFADRKSVV